MNLVIKRIKLYARLTLFVTLALVVAAVIFKNRQHQVTVWFFKTYESINVLWLMACTAGGSVLAWWILSTSLTVWRDLRDVHRATELQREKEQMQHRAEEIAETEKRIDRKIKEAIGDQPDP